MLDITDQFRTARARGPWEVAKVLAACSDGSALPELRAEWDQDAGEQWVRLFKTATLLGLVWVPGPLVIETKGHREVATEVTAVTGTYCEIVVVPHMSSPVLAVQPNRINDIWPDREWPSGAIDVQAMSALDLWYATS